MAGFGGKIELTGASEYKKAITDINSQLRLMTSEMKLTASTFDKTDKSEEGLRKTSEGLNKQITQQKEKIATIKDALQMASDKYGENSKQANAWKVKLNDAEAKLNDLNRELGKNEKALDEGTDSVRDFANAEDDAGKSTIKLGDLIKANLISDAIKTGIKAMANAMLEVGKACVDVGKQALEGYAEYEQLVGGVETLFKESAKQVQEYSNVAYRTAGMSANEYMETVTSFSASLLQGLNGDTKKASEIANQAIIDMSDNANKMGTSMESIQNAYQGFAKGNYTMLDNLKLGYGGTKGEMARLVKESGVLGEAGKDLTAKNFDQKVSFDQIIEAIHKVQDNMGITGTTSKEASTTIEGSINSMKASWQNLLVGFASDGESLNQLIDEFTNSVATAGSNIMPVVERIVENGVKMLPTLITKLAEHLPDFITKGIEIIDSLAKGLQDNLPMIINSAMETIRTLIDGLTDRLPDILQMGFDMLLQIIEGIAEALPDLIPQVVNIIITFMEVFNKNFDKILAMGVKVIMGLIEGLIKSIPQIIANIPTIIKAIINFFTIQKFVSLGKSVISGLINGLKNTFPNVMSEIPKFVGKMINSFKNGGWLNVGKDIIRGICNGLTSMGNFIYDAIKKVGNSMMSGIKKFFGIKSPSKKMKDEVGTFLAEGIGVGFVDEMEDVSKDMTNAIPTSFDTGVTLTTSSSLNGYSSSGSTFGIDYDKLGLAVREAISGMTVDLDNEKVGNFVTRTVEREVFG